MNKYNEIIKNNTFLEFAKKLEELEEGREFCGHDIEHFLAVGRIAYIKSLEEDLGFSKDVIYAVGLLHDLGRVEEYLNNIPHHIASVEIAKEILSGTTYSKEEVNEILKAIEGHRLKKEDANGLVKLMNESDKLSRNCFGCRVKEKCYWSDEKKNFEVTY